MNTPSGSSSPATSSSSPSPIRIILVGTQHPGNIGAAARALKTMGLTQLVLVDPQDFPSDEAFRRAAGADDVLSAAMVLPTLAEAVADCHFVLGCTARSRRVALQEYSPREAAAKAIERSVAGPVGLVFGRERTGLTNEELQLCHVAVHIPANPDYSSLNLAAAVQVLTYELRVALLQDQQPTASADTDVGLGEALAPHGQLEGMFTQLGQTLDEIDFHKGRAPESAMRKLRRLFMRAQLSEQEVRLLRGIMADAQRMARLAGEKGA